MKKTNTVVVGQGIAGSLVAFMLYLKKVPFVVIDPGIPNTASRIAAGMFSPVTGKRKTIDPFLVQQLPFAIATYQQIEQLTGKTIIHLQDTCQLFSSPEEKNELLKKMGYDAYAKYFYPTSDYLPGIKQGEGMIGIKGSGWVDCALFIKSFRNWLQLQNALIPASFVYSDLRIDKEALHYQEIDFKHIIFCEGHRIKENPFFNNENIIPCKGDILTIAYNNSFADHIIKKNDCYLIATGKNEFKVGSTYQWNNNDERLTEAGKSEITGKLDTVLEKKYTIIDHQTGIRPTTLNREVIAKHHPEHSSLLMLNGLGTKGIIQGPWWARYLTTNIN